MNTFAWSPAIDVAAHRRAARAARLRMPAHIQVGAAARPQLEALS